MPERSSGPWRILWQFATGDGVLAVLLVAAAASLALSSWIPQQPASNVDYARWFSEAQSRFGGATSAMRSVGVFNVTNSLGFRVLLALISVCLLLRLVERVDDLRRSHDVAEPSGSWTESSGQQLRPLLSNLRRRRYRVVRRRSVFQVDRWPLARLFPLAAHVGGLLLLLGLLVSRIWGWQVREIVLQVGQRESLPGAANWVALTDDGSGIVHSPGIVGFSEREGPGVLVRALDDGEQALQIQVAASAELSTEAMIPLTEDRYFAIPQADLVVRLTPRSAEADSVVDIQIYRSPPGEMITEMVSERGGDADLMVEGVTVKLTPAPHMLVTATHNPGRWAAASGVFLLMVGVAGTVSWPTHSFWLREQETTISVAGPAPSWVLGEDA